MILSAGSAGIDPGVLRHVLLEDVVLDRPLEPVDRHALLLRRRDVEAEQHRGGAVDGHGGGDLVERDPVEQGLHVGEAGDGHAALPHLALGAGMVGVVAHQGREVEGDGEAGLAALQQELVALVGVLRGPEPGELPHGPEPARGTSWDGCRGCRGTRPAGRGRAADRAADRAGCRAARPRAPTPRRTPRPPGPGAPPPSRARRRPRREAARPPAPARFPTSS